MKKAKILVSCLFLVSLAGGAGKNPPAYRAQSLGQTALSTAPVAALRGVLQEGGELFRAGRYVEASEVFQSAFTSAEALSLPALAGRALGNRGACQYALHQYQVALHSFLEAHRLSESAGDASTAAVWDADLASLYFDLGEYDAAAQWTSQSLERLSGADRVQHLPQLQLQMATLEARRGHFEEAIGLFQKGIDGADQIGDVNLYAIGWNRLGEAFLARGDLPRAEHALLQAYYTRKLYHLALETSYRSLGRLRLAQGDLVSASALLDRAVERAARPQGLMPTWDIYHSRGLVRLAQGRLSEALVDLRTALRLGRAWRWSTPADDAAQVGTEAMLDQVHSAFIEAGNRLYLQAHDPALLRETFQAVEENRAASLRALLRDSRPAPRDLPESYWGAVERYQHAEVTALGNGRVAGLETARADLIRWEASLGLDSHAVPPDLVEASRLVIQPDTALFSFHLGATISWIWALDRNGLAVYALPRRDVIEAGVQAVRVAIRDSQPQTATLSAALYRMLFGPVAARYQRAHHWLVALDDALFDVPIAALIETMQPLPVFVVEQHMVERIPGVAYWVEASTRTGPALSPLFVGVGDAIYNHADDRLGRAFPTRGNDLTLARLVGSASEIETCARAWSGPTVLLRGSDATREKLMDQLEHDPAAVHLAAHYLESAARTREGLIVLSLSPAGNTEVLTPFEIARWHIHTGLVVLSGCHSASGAALPSTGVLGLTRAWLAAGAQTVVASLWDVPDDEGALFEPLYRNLRSTGRLDVPSALREAQLAMIRSGGRLARPGYWGAYFAVGSPGKVVVRP